MGVFREIGPVEPFILGKTKVVPVKKWKTTKDKVPTFEGLSKGSSNLPLLHAVLDRVIGIDNSYPEKHWKAEANSIGHMGAEGPVSTTYAHVHWWCATVGCLKGWAGAREHIMRSMAWSTVCYYNGHVVSPGMRNKSHTNWDMEIQGTWLHHLLRLPYKWAKRSQAHEQEHSTRLMRDSNADLEIFRPESFANACLEWINNRKLLPELAVMLDTIVCGPAPVICQIYEGGGLVHYETGPVGYDNPGPAAAWYTGNNQIITANPRTDLIDSGQFPPKKEEFKPGELVQISSFPNGVICELPSWQWKKYLPVPSGKLLHEIRIPGLQDKPVNTPEQPPESLPKPKRNRRT